MASKMVANPNYRVRQQQPNPMQQKIDARKELKNRIKALEIKAQEFDSQASKFWDNSMIAVEKAKKESQKSNLITSRQYFEQSIIYKNKYEEYVKLAVCTRNYIARVEIAIDSNDLNENVAAVSISLSGITSSDKSRGLDKILQDFEGNYQEMMKGINLTTNVISTQGPLPKEEMDELFTKFQQDSNSNEELRKEEEEDEEEEKTKDLKKRLERLKQKI